jgi:uncharacterized protein (UPF0335 family)
MEKDSNQIWGEALEFSYDYLRVSSERLVDTALQTQHPDIANTILFVMDSLMDIIRCNRLYVTIENPDDKVIIAKATVIYVAEFIKDLGRIVGKRINKWLEISGTNDKLNTSIKDLRKIYHEIREHQNDLESIRNSIAAHKDKDLTIQKAEKNRLLQLDLDGLSIDIQLFMNQFQIFQLLLVDQLGFQIDHNSK